LNITPGFSSRKKQYNGSSPILDGRPHSVFTAAYGELSHALAEAHLFGSVREKLADDVGRALDAGMDRWLEEGDFSVAFPILSSHQNGSYLTLL